MLLNPLYTAPLPAGFTSGTVEIKSPGTYVDQAGRVQQPSYRFSINADGSLTSLQVGGASSIVGMGVGDRSNAPNVDVVIELRVAGSPVPFRTTYNMVPFDSGSGTLRLQQEKQTAPVIVTASVISNLSNQTALYVMGTENISIGAVSLPVETFQPVAPASIGGGSVTSVNSGLASAGLLAKYQSSTAAVPVTPTAQELIDYGVIQGYRTLLTGAKQPVAWDRPSSTWIDGKASSERAPLSAAAQIRGVIFRGGISYYPAPAGLQADGVNVINEGATGLYYRSTGDVMPWEYGALPGLNYTPTNAGAGLAAWTLAAPQDSRLYLPPGDWWTDQSLIVQTTALTLNFRGRLHPMPGFTGYLVNADAGYTVAAAGQQPSYYDTTMQNSLWYKRILVESLVLMGEAKSRGVNFSRWDHFEISNITIHKAYGTAVRMDRMREGNAQNWQMQMCRAGSDNAVFDMSEAGPGDTQNVVNYRGIRIGAFIGRALYYDSPYMNVQESANPVINAPGIPGRFINFDGLSIEDITTAGMKFDDVTTQFPDPTLDVAWFRRGAQINIKSGLLSSANLTTGSVVRIGDSTLAASEAVNSFEMSADIYAFVGTGYAVKVENAKNVNISKEFRLANNVKPVQWPAAGVVPTETRQSFLMRTPGNQPGIRLVNDGMDTPTIGGSPFIQLIDGYGNTALWGQVGTSGLYSKSIHKPAIANNTTFSQDTNGALWVSGNQLKLGSAGDQVAWVKFGPQTGEPYDKSAGSMAIGGSSAGWNPLARGLAFFPMFYNGTAWVEVNTGLVPTTAPANLTAAPSMADFNNLLSVLRASKILL